MPNALVPLASFTLTSAQATVVFAGIPSNGFRDLRLVVSAATATEGNFFVRVNSDSGNNYAYVNMRGSGGGAQSSSAGSASGFITNFTTGQTAGEVGTNVYDFFDYAQTDKQKSVLVRNNHTGEVGALAGRWANTSAIISVTIYGNTPSGNFSAGSTFNLFGVIG